MKYTLQSFRQKFNLAIYKLFIIAVFITALGIMPPMNAHGADRPVVFDGAILYNEQNFVLQVDESKILNSIELKTVEKFRKNTSYFKSSAVMSLNLASLHGGLITLVLPTNGTRYQFAGQEKIVDGTKDTIWYGADKNGATLMIADDEQGTSGVLRDKEKIFEIYALPGKRFYIFVENATRRAGDHTSYDGAGKTQGK